MDACAIPRALNPYYDKARAPSCTRPAASYINLSRETLSQDYRSSVVPRASGMTAQSENKENYSRPRVDLHPCYYGQRRCDRTNDADKNNITPFRKDRCYRGGHDIIRFCIDRNFSLFLTLQKPRPHCQ